jgi:hypothetical protein
MLQAWSYLVSGSLSVKDQLAEPIGGFFTKFPFPPLLAPPLPTLPVAAIHGVPPLTLVLAIFLKNFKSQLARKYGITRLDLKTIF